MYFKKVSMLIITFLILNNIVTAKEVYKIIRDNYEPSEIWFPDSVKIPFFLETEPSKLSVSFFFKLKLIFRKLWIIKIIV